VVAVRIADNVGAPPRLSFTATAARAVGLGRGRARGRRRAPYSSRIVAAPSIAFTHHAQAFADLSAHRRSVPPKSSWNKRKARSVAKWPTSFRFSMIRRPRSLESKRSSRGQLSECDSFTLVGRTGGRPKRRQSRLFNALAGYERAIVDPTPGTTRDVVTIRTALTAGPSNCPTRPVCAPLPTRSKPPASPARAPASRGRSHLLVLDRAEPLTVEDLTCYAHIPTR